MICENCNHEAATTSPRPDGMSQCDACWRAALVHGHAHGLHQNEDGCFSPVAMCPTCEATTPAEAAAVVRELARLGVTATIEHPGYLEIVVDGATLACGTVNEFWTADRLSEDGDAIDGASVQTTVPSIEPDAERIARALVAALDLPQVTYGVRAYSTSADERRAGRAEAAARNGRR